jgi:hypothetical protein
MANQRDSGRLAAGSLPWFKHQGDRDFSVLLILFHQACRSVLEIG